MGSLNRRLSLAFSFLPLIAWSAVPSGAEVASSRCVTINIEGLGSTGLDSLESSMGFSRWLELDDIFFACGEESLFEGRALDAWRPRVEKVWTDLDPNRLYVVRAAHPGGEVLTPGLTMITRGGPYAVVRVETDEMSSRLLRGLWPDHQVDGDGCHRPRVEPFNRSLVLARRSSNSARLGTTAFGPEAGEAAGAVDFSRWFTNVETLAGWNRHTHGSQIDEASDFLESSFVALGLPVTKPTFQVGGTTANNVIATYTGTVRPDDWYIVGAHYDSTSQNTSQAAPGAEDNASGCAGVLELANVLVPRQPEATILFMCYSGEEQGLFGSEDHVSDLVASGDASKIQGILTMDMIGYTGDAELDVLLETTNNFASVLDIYEDAAATFTTLTAVTSLFAFGSDHVPYLDNNLPALLTIENDWDSYPGYHRTNDLASNLSLEMGGQVLRMNAAVLAHQTGVGSNSVVFRNGFESGDTLGWSLSMP